MITYQQLLQVLQPHLSGLVLQTPYGKGQSMSGNSNPAPFNTGGQHQTQHQQQQHPSNMHSNPSTSQPSLAYKRETE